ncbi:MAG: hypothetical protein NTZ50_08155 [Chloroflexi bacterium]|nr:hypothetical protein [Chloroflexota bacterium]
MPNSSDRPALLHCSSEVRQRRFQRSRLWRNTSKNITARELVAKLDQYT